MKNKESPANFPAFQLTQDSSMEPRFRQGDIVYYLQNPQDRSEPDAQAAYLVEYEGTVRVRYLRMGGKRLYLATVGTLRNPGQWDYVSLADRHILEIVRGKIVWICRKVEEAEAGPFEEAGGDHGRAGGEGQSGDRFRSFD